MIDGKTKFLGAAGSGLFAALALAASVAAASAGDNAAFRDGDVQGCTSGYADAGRDGYQDQFRKDQARYAGDAEYRSGWDAGHVRCYEDQQRHPKILGGN